MAEETPGRVIFSNNPLVGVVGEVRFPMQLEIDQIAPVEFQKRISSEYPNLQVQELKTLTVENSRESTAKSKVYIFRDTQEIWQAHLTSNTLALTCLNYKNWEEFSGKLEYIVMALTEIYPAIPHVERIGLLYDNIILKSKLRTKANWGSLVQPFLLGPMVPKGLPFIPEVNAETFKEFQSMIHMTLEAHEAQDGLILHYGLVRSKTSDEEAFLMDFDFYNEKIRGFSHDDILRVFARLHGYAYRVFRHCITPKLYGLLGPGKI